MKRTVEITEGCKVVEYEWGWMATDQYANKASSAQRHSINIYRHKLAITDSVSVDLLTEKMITFQISIISPFFIYSLQARR